MVQLRLDSVRIQLEGTDKVVDVNCNVVKILEKKGIVDVVNVMSSQTKPNRPYRGE